MLAFQKQNKEGSLILKPKISKQSNTSYGRSSSLRASIWLQSGREWIRAKNDDIFWKGMPMTWYPWNLGLLDRSSGNTYVITFVMCHTARKAKVRQDPNRCVYEHYRVCPMIYEKANTSQTRSMHATFR